jgi:hypothetical protein
MHGMPMLRDHHPDNPANTTLAVAYMVITSVNVVGLGPYSLPESPAWSATYHSGMM